MFVYGAEPKMKDFINSVVDMYFKYLECKPLDCMIYTTYDLNQVRLNLAPKKLHQELLENPYPPNTTGAILLPYSNGGRPAILLQKSQFGQDIRSIHELMYYLTYLLDSKWCYKVFNLDFNAYTEPTDTICAWCDWHSELIAYSYEIKLAYNSGISLDQLLFRFQDEDSFIRQGLYSDLLAEKSIPRVFVSHIMSILGTYVALNMVYPKQFNENTLPKALINICGNKIKTLFTFLRSTTTNQELLPKITEFNSLVQSTLIYTYS